VESAIMRKTQETVARCEITEEQAAVVRRF